MRLLKRGSLLGFVLVMALIGACSGSSSSTTTAPPGSTTVDAETTSSTTNTTSISTTTSSPTTTTTSSTVPPGLAPQALSFGFEDGMLVRYDAVETTASVISLGEAEGAFAGLDRGVTLSSDVSGELWQLTLGGREDGTFEVIWDFRPEEGSVGGEVEDLEYSEGLEVDNLEYFGGVLHPFVVDATGRVVADSANVPWFSSVHGSVLDRSPVLIPPLPEGSVDVGDSWAAEIEDPQFGLIGFQLEVVAEAPLEEGFAFEIVFEGTPATLPLPLAPLEASRLVAWATAEPSSEVLSALAGLPDEAIALAVSDAALEGRFLLDPATGRMLELECSLLMALDLEASRGEDGLSMSVEMAASVTATLATASPAEGFQRVSVLDRFGIEPWSLAEGGLSPLIGYELLELDEGQFEWDLGVIRETPAVVDSIVYGKFSNGEQQALVLSMAQAGHFRGAPILGKALAYEWNPPYDWHALEYTFNGEQIFRLHPPADNWVVWVSEDFIFVVIGPNPLRDELLTVLMDGHTEPYWWRAGDCLDLTYEYEYGTELPRAPVGPLGLRHCAGPHTWEVLTAWALEEGPDDPYPADLGSSVSQQCGEVYFERFDAPPLAQGLELGVLYPDRDEWRLGRRYGACVVAEYTPGGITALDERLTQEAITSSYDPEVGDCVVRAMGSLVPTSCGAAHLGEIVGIVVHDGDGDRPPEPETVEIPLLRQCEREMWDRGTPDLRAEVAPVTDMFIAWDQGVREVYCVASIRNEFGWPVDIKGEFYGDWEFADEQVGT